MAKRTSPLVFKSKPRQQLRKRLYEGAGFRCERCGWKPESIPEKYDGEHSLYGHDSRGKLKVLEIDHVVSRLNGGTHEPDNLQVLCSSCNTAKGGK